MHGSARSGAARIFVALLFTAACTSAPAGPGATDADPNGEITTPVQKIPDGIDPLFTGTFEQVRHVSMLFEALITFDAKTLAPIPAAARDLPRISADGLTYTFTLRDGLTYSDGSSLTAKDFAFAFSRNCVPGLAPGLLLGRLIVGCDAIRRLDPKKTSSGDLAAVRTGLGVKAASDTELVVTLIELAPYFVALASLPNTFPVREADVARAGDAYGTPQAVSALVGNGPFRLVEWTPDQRLVFERNERYRSPAKLKRWTKVVVPLDVALAAYRNGEIDLFGGVPSSRVASVAENLAVIDADPELRAQIVHAPAAITDYFVLNVSRPPFTDRRVRQAFAKAIDRDEQTREFLTFSAPARSLVPPGRPGHDPGDSFQTFDPAQARELLRSSSFAGRPELSTIKIVFPQPSTRTPAEFLQQQLKKHLGIEVTLELVDPATMADLMKAPTTTPHIRFNRHGESFPDPAAWFTAFSSASGSAREVGYRNAEVDALLGDASRELDPQRRAGLYGRASRILSEDVVAIWFIWQENTYLRKPRVKGMTDSARDVEYGQSRFTEIYVTKRS